MKTIADILRNNKLTDLEKIAAIEEGLQSMQFNLEEKDDAGASIAHIAGIHCTPTMMKWLLSRNPNFISAVSSGGTNILFYALKNCNSPVVTYLVNFKDPETGVPVGQELARAVNNNGANSLHFAALGGAGEIYKQMQAIENAPKHSPDKSGNYPIHYATENAEDLNHSLKAIQHLIAEEKGSIELPTEGEYGQKPLFIAALRGRWEQFQYLWTELRKTKDAATIVKEHIDKKGCPLVFAVADGGNVQILRLLRAEKVDLNEINNKWHPLHQAASKGNLDAVKFFVEEEKTSPELPTEDELGTRSLSLAAEYGFYEVFEYLWKELRKTKEAATIVKEYASKKGFPLLWRIINGGNRKILRLLRADGINVNEIYYNTHPFHRAAERGKLEAVKFYVEEEKISLELPTEDEYGQKPLFIAAQKKQPEVFKYLWHELRKNKDAATILKEHINKKGHSLIQVVLESGCVEIWRFLRTEGIHLIHEAAKRGELNGVKFFVEEEKVPLDFPTQDEYGTKPLFVAAAYGHYEVFKYLWNELRKNKDAATIVREHISKLGYPLTHIIARGGNVQILRLLQGEGINLKENYYGHSLLHEAVMSGRLDAVKYFIKELGFPLDLPTEDQNGATLLFLAAKYGQWQIFKYIWDELRKQKDAVAIVKDNANRKGEPLTHAAAEGGNVDILRLLHNSSINLDTPHKGLYPLHLSVIKKRTEATNFLVNEVRISNGEKRKHFRFKMISNLKEHLDNAYPGNYKLVEGIQTIFKQPQAPVCKLTAITNVLNFYHARNNITKAPLPVLSNNPESKSARQFTKEVGSETGRLYNQKMIRDLIPKLGTAMEEKEIMESEVQFETCATPDAYISALKNIIDTGLTLPVVFFDKNDFGLPVIDGKGEHEHGAVIAGYCGSGNDFSFILGQWGRYYIVNALELTRAAANLKEGSQPPRYYFNVQSEQIKMNWRYESNSEDLCHTLYNKFLKTSKRPPTAFEDSCLERLSRELFPPSFKQNVEVTYESKETNERVTFTCSITPGCLDENIKWDFRSTICVIVPKSLKQQLLKEQDQEAKDAVSLRMKL